MVLVTALFKSLIHIGSLLHIIDFSFPDNFECWEILIVDFFKKNGDDCNTYFSSDVGISFKKLVLVCM